jgi:hypothetical protein
MPTEVSLRAEKSRAVLTPLVLTQQHAKYKHTMERGSTVTLVLR